MRRGYSPNDTHPGHLAQIEKDLLDLRPRLLADPEAEVRQARAALALALTPVGEKLFNGGGENGAQWSLPAEGALLVEYDWVIPRRAQNGEAALRFLRQAAQTALVLPGAAGATSRLVPLAPLPDEALAERAATWARIRRLSA
jgi:spermidine/putrescine-binding protein